MQKLLVSLLHSLVFWVPVFSGPSSCFIYLFSLVPVLLSTEGKNAFVRKYFSIKLTSKKKECLIPVLFSRGQESLLVSVLRVDRESG